MTKEELEQYRRSARFTAFNAPKIVDELIAEIERLQSEREWRPIETVPEEVKKYGTRDAVEKLNGTPLSNFLLATAEQKLRAVHAAWMEKKSNV